MDTAWQILRDGGLPLGQPSSGVRRTAHELATATRAAIALDPTGREADALAAFILGWQHHWPACFAAELAADAGDALAWAARNVVDANRYLKLRRIAIENLSKVI